MTTRKLVLASLVGSSIATAAPAAPPSLTAADRAAAFKAAGFSLKGKQWQACGDPGTASYTPGTIEMVRDLNGDGRPEALITEGSVYCFGDTGTGFTLVGRQTNGSWRPIYSATGMPEILPTKGAGGWPDIEVGGPGFCFPVVRWNGKAYAVHRHQYEGKPCRR